MGRPTCAMRSGSRRPPRCAAPGVVVCLAGTIEPADDVMKMHASALDTFASPNGGSLGRIAAGEVERLPAAGRASTGRDRAGRRAGPPDHRHGRDGRLAAGRRGRGRRRRDRRRRHGRREHGSALLAAAERAIDGGPAGRAGHADVRRVGPGPPTPSRAAARRGSGPGRSRSAICARSRPGSRWRSGSGPVSTATGWRRSSPTHYPDTVPLDTLITGRIATLAGDDGFGWVEAIGIRDGRVAFAGSEVYLETRADPFTERIALEPDQVAIPGLTDAHLHLARVAAGTRQVDLADAATLPDGLERVRAAHAALADPDAWLEGHGWDVDRWGRWPTADDLEAVAPGRRCALWAHDHHSLLVSRAGLETAGVTRDTSDPPGGLIRRDARRGPRGRACSRRPRAWSRSTSRRWRRPTSRPRSSRSRSSC